MKSSVAATVWLCASACGTLSRGSPPRHLRLSLVPHSVEVHQEERIELEARLWNESPRAVKVVTSLTWPHANFRIDVVGPGGTALVFNGAVPDNFPSDTVVIRPRAYVRARIVLDRGADRTAAFRFVEPGVYRISATLGVFDPQSHRGEHLRSDVATVRLSP